MEFFALKNNFQAVVSQPSTPAPLEFIRRLKQFIHRSGLKTSEIAANTNISRAHLSRLLSGERGVPAIGNSMVGPDD